MSIEEDGMSLTSNCLSLIEKKKLYGDRRAEVEWKEAECCLTCVRGTCLVIAAGPLIGQCRVLGDAREFTTRDTGWCIHYERNE